MLENGFYISIHKEKQIVHINCMNNNTLDCKTIYNIILESIRGNQAYQDINLQDLCGYEIYVFLDSILLTGGTESNKSHNECYFGELDSNNTQMGLDESQPIYFLQSNGYISNIDSKVSYNINTNISTDSNLNPSNTDSSNNISNKDYNTPHAYTGNNLQIYYNNSSLTLLNYSLLDSSLNIKLECNSKESKEILEREQTQREQTQKESTPIDSLTSTAMLHPILEDNELKCPHNGVVKLKSNKGKPFKSKGIPMILESDLLNSSIQGCTNPLLSGGPCTMVATILPNVRGLKKFNDDYPIMQDLCISGVMSDKGFPIICTPKENTFKINSPSPSNANTQSKEVLSSQVDTSKPSLRLHYKANAYQQDNLPIYRIKLNDTSIESSNELDYLSIDIAKDTQDFNHKSNFAIQDMLSQVYTNLQESYKSYEHRYFSLQLDSNLIVILLLIPQHIPKIYTDYYNDYEYKEYGIGKYHYVSTHCIHELEITDLQARQ